MILKEKTRRYQDSKINTSERNVFRKITLTAVGDLLSVRWSKIGNNMTTLELL